MELTEPIESINQQLIDLYGVDSDDGKPIFRVVSSWDQFEKRLTDVTIEGFKLQQPEICEMPKYDQRDLDYRGMYILERRVIVPVYQTVELASEAKSYEPLWVFRDKDLNPLPPAIWACQFVVNTLYAALGKSSLAKYVDEEAKNPVEFKRAAVQKLEEELFGDESSLLLRTVTGEAIVVPQSYETTQKKESE